MWLAIVIALIGGIGSIGAVFQARSAVKAAQNNTQVKVDAEAYIRAKTIYESSIDEMQSQITQMRLDLSDQRAENVKLRTKVSELESQLITLRNK